TTFPANMGLGVIGSEEVCYRFGQMVGEESRAVGVHLVSAPVVDVNSNPENPVIGVRSFGEEPELVSRLGVATLRGIQSAGAIAMAKHFPGHGDTAVDSHLGVPTVAHPIERLQSVELQPFHAAVAAGVQSLCTAHALYPALDDTPNTVATVSPKILGSLLRTAMGYDGLVFSDCLTMQGIVQTVGTARGAVEFIQAGGDVAIVCHTFDAPVEAFEAVLKAAQWGGLSEERINQSVRRVLEAKEKLGLLDSPFVDVDAVTDVVGTADKIAFARQVAANAVTVIKDEAHLLPLRLPAEAPLLLLCPPEAEPLAQVVRENHPNTVVISPADASRTVSELQRSHTFIAVYWHRCASWGKVPEGEEKLSQYFRQHPRSILISLVSPYEARRFAHASTIVTAFSAKETSQKATADMIFKRSRG
ncbi:MAG: glycoside hydrolase family 3 protein, partial [Abditibacteriales bacterium]|nr:glycoside hydrolase family 3 protein [Abditibacteriales bacterium]MDW8367961.1 glycoside hydrolase family 3 protein [Abditibacteriales bacterium]